MADFHSSVFATQPLNLLWTDSSPVVERVKTLHEGLFALLTKVALMSIRHLAVSMSLWMTTEPTFHSFLRDERLILLYYTHIPLMHNQAAYHKSSPIAEIFEIVKISAIGLHN